MLGRIDVDTGYEILGGGGDGGSDKLSALERYLRTIERAMARLRGETEDTNKRLEEFNQRVAQGEFKGESSRAIEAARQRAIAYGELEQKAKLLKAAESELVQVSNQFTEVQARLTRDLEKAGSVENPYVQAMSGAAKYRTQLEGLVQRLDEKIALLEKEGILTDELIQLEMQREEIQRQLVQTEKLAAESGLAKMRQELRNANEQYLTAQERREVESDLLAQQKDEMLRALREQNQLTDENRSAVEAWYEAMLRITNMSGFEQMMLNWRDAAEGFDQMWQNSMSSFTDTLAEGLVEGKLAFEDFADSMLKELLQVILRALIAKTILQSLGLGGVGTAQPQVNFGDFQMDTSSFASAFADGGIMTPAGPAALKKYANGGIAHSPQLALFGEGSQPEAYVPLPDGRTIPVTIQGDSGRGGDVYVPPVEVNVINESGEAVEAENRGSSFDGERFVVDVVLKHGNRPGPLRDMFQRK